MPGIVGVLGHVAPGDRKRLIGTMVASMLHEGSYVSGEYYNPDLGVYAGWVAHAGRSTRPPSSLAHEKSTVLLSGEVFSSSAEFETIPQVYERYGDSFAEQLDGGFAGLLIDSERRHAYLFNDRFGTERLYYHERGGVLFFASEAKALLAVLPELQRFDDEGVVQYLTFGSTLGGRTLFRGVGVMPAGSLWVFDGRGPPTRRVYFRPDQWLSLPQLGKSEFRERLAAAFSAAVRTRMATREPVGISITGGVDTRMLMACVPPAANVAGCYTFAGSAGETLDVRLGRRVAQSQGFQHRVLRIGPEFLERYDWYVDRTVLITDGCAGALGAHEIYFNALAREVAPVRLTGNFGSEILRGMSTYKPLNLAEQALSPDVRTQIATLRTSRFSGQHPVIFAAFEEIPTTHFGIPAAARSQLTFRSPFLSNAIVELAVRAPTSELASPAACGSVIERYAPALGEIPTDRGVLPKSVPTFRPLSRGLAEVTFKLDYWHTEGLPSKIRPLAPVVNLLSAAGFLGLHKYLPYRVWFRTELSAYVRSVLNDASTRRMPWWNTSSLDDIFLEHVSGRRNWLREINAVLTLSAVQRCLMGAPSMTPHS